MLDFYVKTWIRFSLRDKRLFEITEVEITRVDCSHASLGSIEYIRTRSKMIQQMAKSLLLTPDPIHAPDPGVHQKQCYRDILNQIWEVSALKLQRYEQSKRFNAKL